MTVSLIRVAIVGGGPGGTLLMNALTKHPQLDVQLYEANVGLEESGASIGIMENSQRALDLLGMGDIVKKAQAVELEKFRISIGEGDDGPKMIIDIHQGLQTVHRATLLKELIASIPRENFHFGKSLESISGTTLQFQDGSSTSADVIIGADGVHSNIRRYVLGQGHPAVKPVYAGFWDCWAVMPVDKAIEKIGATRLDLSSSIQQAYVDNGVWLMHDLMENGTQVCVIASGPTPADWDSTQWKRPVSRAWLASKASSFGEFGTAMLDLLFDGKDEIPAFVQWSSAEAPKLYNGSICMIGDAAHATTPWLASGLALSIEDSLILQSVLGKCNSVTDVPAAFEAYDRVMRPRGQSVIEASQQQGQTSTTTETKGGSRLDAKSLANLYRQRWEFVTKWDTTKAVHDALRHFEELTTTTRRENNNSVV